MEYTKDGCLNLVIQTYYQDNSLSKDKKHKNYYLNWLENDMLFVINNHNSLYEAIPLKLIRSCPNILESIITNGSTVNILNHIRYLWDIMDDFQKQKMLRGYLIANNKSLGQSFRFTYNSSTSPPNPVLCTNKSAKNTQSAGSTSSE